MSTTKTGIEWTDRTWNPVRGCSRVSEGCRNCYAEKVAARFSDEGQAFNLFADRNKSGSKWTGKVELIEPALREPMKWRKPVRIFVNSMSDLFHENLPNESIDKIFAVMALCPQHTFQILTKRPERIRDYLSNEECEQRIAELHMLYAFTRDFGSDYEFDAREAELEEWPLPNVWLGVSVEDQVTADERIPLLLQTPAAVRFVSYEPALGPVDFDGEGVNDLRALGCGDSTCRNRDGGSCRGIDWVIIGGESGPNARPFNIRWARSAVQQCADAGIACFVKQLGANARTNAIPGYDDAMERLDLKDRKGGDWDEWPADLRVRQFPKAPA